MDVYSLFPPCMSGSLLPPQQQSERGLMSVYLSSLSLYSLFLSRESDLWGLGGYRGKVQGGKKTQGKWLHLETIKDVSSVLCLVCSPKSTG